MYYVLDDKGNRVEGYDKQGFLAFLQEAINKGDLTGIDGESAFVSKLKCCVGGQTFKMAFVTNAKYNELLKNNQLEANALYFITDDNSYNDLFEEVNKIINGTTTVPSAEIATKATNTIRNSDNTYSGFIQDENGVLKVGEEIICKKVLILETGKTGTEGIYSDPIVYSMPTAMTSNGRYMIENSYGEIGEFRCNGSTSHNFYHIVGRIGDTGQAFVVPITFDFTARTITVGTSKQIASANLWLKPHITRIWKIIE